MLIAEYSYEKDIQVKQWEALQIGIEQGIEKGIEQGIEKGIEQGIEKGIEDGEYKTLYELICDGTITKETAAAKKNHTVDEFWAELRKRNIIQ